MQVCFESLSKKAFLFQFSKAEIRQISLASVSWFRMILINILASIPYKPVRQSTDKHHGKKTFCQLDIVHISKSGGVFQWLVKQKTACPFLDQILQ